MIYFNKPFISGRELEYMSEVFTSGKIAGSGLFTKKCHEFFESAYGFRKCFLTTSCTAALEMTALLIDIQPGDEVIVPSYTFVSTANAFILRGAKIVFCDSGNLSPNIDTDKIENLITPRTKAIVAVHYGGIASDMDKILDIANSHGLFVIEDAASSIDSYYKNKPLGSIGHFGCFSFHETKNVVSGEGGMLVVNDEKFIQRAEIIWEKGTNRSAFLRGESDKYNWIDIGSSFMPSEFTAAFLFAQSEEIKNIQNKRKNTWNKYYEGLKPLEEKKIVSLPLIPEYATNNAHLFYLVCNNAEDRIKLIRHLNNNEIQAVFHYLSLHNSPFFAEKYVGEALPNAERYSNSLLRLPLYYELTEEDVKKVIFSILQIFLRPF